MLKNTILLALVSAILSMVSIAGTIGEKNFSAWGKGITLSIGPAWTNPGDTQIIYFSPDFPQKYIANTATATLGSGEIFLNLQKYITKDFLGQFGVALAATTSIPLKGEIWQDADPEFNNFNYSYKINHSHIALRSKFLQEMSWIQPYISASLGIGFNHTYHYTNTPKIPEVTAEPSFASNTNTAFTYTLDIGIHKKLDKAWAIELGYEFADWGKSFLNPSADQTSKIGLNLNHVYTNALQISLSFVS